MRARTLLVIIAGRGQIVRCLDAAVDSATKLKEVLSAEQLLQLKDTGGKVEVHVNRPWWSMDPFNEAMHCPGLISLAHSLARSSALCAHSP